jgi:hypothetical protein
MPGDRTSKLVMRVRFPSSALIRSHRHPLSCFLAGERHFSSWIRLLSWWTLVRRATHVPRGQSCHASCSPRSGASSDASVAVCASRKNVPSALAMALVVAAVNAAEARLVPGITVIGASRLAEVTGWLRCGSVPQVPLPQPADRPPAWDAAETGGNLGALTAAQVSAAGGHRLSLTGPPGLTSAPKGSRLVRARIRVLKPTLLNGSSCSGPSTGH